MPQNFYEFVWIFIIYAFVGWCVEVAYAALDTGKFVNRGFLNGPYCPIYGFGVVIVVGLLTPLKDNRLILFAGSFVLTTSLEFITGYVLEKVFHNKWWDYSDKPFNIKGYICLKFSILWGLGCTFIMDAFHPMVYKIITWIPLIPGTVILCILMSVFIVDGCITISTILKFNKRLKLMDEMAATIHRLSDEIGENIYENVTGVIEKSEAFKENHSDLIEKLEDKKQDIEKLPKRTKEIIAEARENITELPEATRAKIIDKKEDIAEKRRQLAELTERYEKLLAERNVGFRRLLLAFPDMISRENNEMLNRIKNHLNSKKNKSNEEK